MKDGKYLYSDLDGRVYLRIKDRSYKCLTADTNTGWGEGEKGDIDELIPSMWELVEDPKVTELSEQLAKANERADYYMKLVTSDIGYEHAKDLEKGILEEIENRDNLEEWLDKLSVEIARYFGVDIGEHSSANNPWVEAFEAIPEDTLNKFAIEKKIEGAYAVISLLDETKDSKTILMANNYVREQLRKEQDSE